MSHRGQLRRLGAILRDARVRRDLRLREVAPLLGVGISVLHGYENGDREPPALRLITHARVLGIDLRRFGRAVARGRVRKAA